MKEGGGLRGMEEAELHSTTAGFSLGTWLCLHHGERYYLVRSPHRCLTAVRAEISLCTEGRSDLAHSKSVTARERVTGLTPRLILLPHQVTGAMADSSPCPWDTSVSVHQFSCAELCEPLGRTGRWVTHTDSETGHGRVAAMSIIPVGSGAQHKPSWRRGIWPQRRPPCYWGGCWFRSWSPGWFSRRSSGRGL